jgi:hypothetical protein
MFIHIIIHIPQPIQTAEVATEAAAGSAATEAVAGSAAATEAVVATEAVAATDTPQLSIFRLILNSTALAAVSPTLSFQSLVELLGV